MLERMGLFSFGFCEVSTVLIHFTIVAWILQYKFFVLIEGERLLDLEK
jgi:hypothetical protein